MKAMSAIERVLGVLTGDAHREALPSLSEKEAVILRLLIQEEEQYGLQLVAASEGALKRGTVYVTLGRMEEKGYVTSRPEVRLPGAIGLPRRLYRPTERGRAVLAAWEGLALTLAARGVAP